MTDLPMTPLFTLAAGIACAEVLRELAQVLVELKPINDLYVGKRKLGGILTESLVGERFGLPHCRGLITGIGINVYECAPVYEGCRIEDRSEERSENCIEDRREECSLTRATVPSERRANEPTSLQACVPPLLFGQWHDSVIKQELRLAVAERVDRYYRALVGGAAQAILARYLLFKMDGVELPEPLRQMMAPSGH